MWRAVTDETQTRALADHAAIVDLAVRYCWALDERNFDDLRQVFTPDATATLGGVDCAGIDAIIERVDRALTPLDASMHLVGSHQVAVDGDRATARCYLHAQHVRRGTEGGDNFVVAGIYDDRLVRTADGWRIAHRTLSTVWTDGNPEVTRRGR